jgi:hypothetical protein
MSSELQLPTVYTRYGISTYLMVTAAVLSLLSMSLVLWRIVSIFIFVDKRFPKHNLFLNSIFAGFITIISQN